MVAQAFNVQIEELVTGGEGLEHLETAHIELVSLMEVK